MNKINNVEFIDRTVYLATDVGLITLRFNEDFTEFEFEKSTIKFHKPTTGIILERKMIMSKTITVYAIVDKNGNLIDTYPNKESAEFQSEITDTVIELTGEYDDTPKVSNCPFCGKQPKIVDKFVGNNSHILERQVTCCNGIKTDIEGWENRV